MSWKRPAIACGRLAKARKPSGFFSKSRPIWCSATCKCRGKAGSRPSGSLRVEHPNVKIVAMSGGSFEGSANLLDIAVEVGASVALRKPFALEGVPAVVETILARDRTE